MKTRKYAILGLLALAFLIAPFSTHAQVIPEPCDNVKQCTQIINLFQQVIALLTQQIQLLQEQLQPCQQPGAVYNYQTGNSCATNTPSITVLSPNGGESWFKGDGQSEQVLWQQKNIPSDINIEIVFRYFPDGNPYSKTFHDYLAAYSSSDFGGVLTLDLTATTPGCLPGGIWSVTTGKFCWPPGVYTVKVKANEGAIVTEDWSDSYFKIYDSTQPGNLPPSISGVSGPTTLEVGKSGTWSVTASDPENGPLSYSVKWGDEAITGSTAGSVTVQQTATFTHTYSTAGTYSPTFIVTDDKGQSAKTSLSVVVGGPIIPSVTISNQAMSVGQIEGIDHLANVTAEFSLQSKNGIAYISKNPSIALAVGTNAVTASFLVVTADLCSSCGDTSTYFIVPDGVLRTFTYSGQMNNQGGTVGVKSMWVDKIYWDDDAVGLQEFAIASGLDALRRSIFLGNGGTQPAPTITSSNPPNGAIDARGAARPGDLTGPWAITLYASGPTSGYQWNNSDFSVSSTYANLPAISITGIFAYSNWLGPTLSRNIESGERITLTHKPSNFSVCLGFLPGNVDQDGWSLSRDISLLNSWVGTAEGAAKPFWQTDINRDGVFDAKDVTRAGELMSAPNRVYRIPACPAPTLGVSPAASQNQLANTLSSLNSLLQTLKQSLAR